MKICIAGSSAREHAFAVTLGRHAHVVVAPGNHAIPGSTLGPAEAVEADLYVVGPEQLLSDGLADRLRSRGKLVLGPGVDGVRLESSKIWLKQLLVDVGVPTARYGSFQEVAPAVAFLEQMTPPYVIKTDGLAEGKGVLVTSSFEDAVTDIRGKLSGRLYGAAGCAIVIEEYLPGAELSLFALTDGRTVVCLGCARDHKRFGDGDTGPNTGGMGAYSPVPGVIDTTAEDLVEAFVRPVVAEMRARGIDYRGFLYAGLMSTPAGYKVLEFNARFGDPEAQVILPRLEGNLAELFESAAAGRLEPQRVRATGASVGIVIANGGYPTGPLAEGAPLTGLESAKEIEGIEVFLGGVGEHMRTRGGRVLTVVGTGSDLSSARQKAYMAVERVKWPGAHFRSDIAATCV